MAEKFSTQLQVSEDIYQKSKYIAAMEMRSLNAQFEYFLSKGIAEYEREHGAIKILSQSEE